MPVTKVSATEFRQAVGRLSDNALAGPVVITKHGRDVLVVMSAEEWVRLKAALGKGAPPSAVVAEDRPTLSVGQHRANFHLGIRRFRLVKS